MSILEVFAAAVDLDFVFFVDLIMNNLFWVFGFLAIGYYTSTSKNWILTGIVSAAIVLATIDLFQLLEFSLYTGYGLMLIYISRLVVSTALEHSKTMSNYMPLAFVLCFYMVLGLVALGVL